MTPEARLNKIVDDGLCIGCGLCQSLLGAEAVQVRSVDSGELRPVTRRTLTDNEVAAVYATCPGTRAEGLPEPQVRKASHHDLVWGAYQQLVLGWAGDSTVRHEGSTGGVLTALGQFLLRSKKVDFVLHVKASTSQPTHGEPTLSFTEADVFSGAGSRYGPTAPLRDLESALAREQPFALIAKPCDLNAVRNLAHRDPRVNQLVKYWLTPVCGGYMPDQSTADFLQDQAIDREDIAEFRYRGRGCPGPTTATLKNGEKKSYHYLDFWGEDESAWSLPFRCKICPDGIGEGADIAAADTWPAATPDREGSKTDLGTNSMIVRTQAGADLLAEAVREGALQLGETIDIDYMNRTQPHQVTKKYAVQARYLGLQDAGRLVPETHGLRLEALYQCNTDEENQRQRRGAYERARKSSS